MSRLIDHIAEMRNPLTYGIDIVSGVRALGMRRTGRVMAQNLLMSTGVGAGLTVLGGAAVESVSFVDPAAVTMASPTAATEAVGLALGASVVAGVMQGVHQVSKEGEEVREAQTALRRDRRDTSERESRWLV